jgi:BolA protein|tara:strand:+ start:103 stop:360 length:258 start_codon:yes stop_codon:yes gene_type:complete
LIIEKQIESILIRTFEPKELLIKNQSHLHKAHKEYNKESHFAVHITSKIFNEKSRLERHQMVYQALEDLMKSKIHALQIKATTTN